MAISLAATAFLAVVYWKVPLQIIRDHSYDDSADAVLFSFCWTNWINPYASDIII
ncbi:hypothetical protein [Litchfieldia alkalitelluris]|uniref:hypothetical protein n=1 Tax=Litchfieldia alkalitelluris TaxID=304268 RepID=UPI00195A2FF9|nr:hypothetical protein [Litchfieldia alkalitelluris]